MSINARCHARAAGRWAVAAAVSAGTVGAASPALAAAAAPRASFSDVGLAGPLPAAFAQAGSTAPYAATLPVAPTPLSAPTAVSALGSGDGGAVVSWVAPGASQLAATDAYWVQSYTSQGAYLGEQSAAPAVTSATVTGLVPGNSYLFAVLAESAGSFSGYRFSAAAPVGGYTGQPGLPTHVGPYPVPAPTVGSGALDINPKAFTAQYTAPTAAELAAAQAAAATATAPPVGVLGKEAWQTYFDFPSPGQGQQLQGNVANGNVVLSATDSTPVQAHGQLAYALRRTYNSLDSASLVTGPGSIGQGWRLNLGEEAGDAQSLGVLGEALDVPNATSVQPGAITLIDRDGTRHTFTPKATGSALTVDSSLGDGLAALVLEQGCRVDLYPCAPIRAVSPASHPLLCVDQSYQSPAGVHLGLWRYLSVTVPTAVTACPANPASLAGAVVVGYAAERPDRLLTEYASTGELLSMVDRAGVELRYEYDLAPAPGQALGRLRAVYEPRSCPGYSRPSATDPGTVPASCRAFRLAYGTTPSGGTTVTVTDPANRPTVYTLSNSNPQLLTSVGNPDGSTLGYTYQGQPQPGALSVACGGTAGQLCSVSDALGHTTALSYSTGRLAGVVDRRGTVYTASPLLSGAAPSSTVTWGPAGAAPTHLNTYRGIDGSGRVGEVLQGSPSATYRDTSYTWDTPGATCNTPVTVDNDLCSVVQHQLGSQAGAPPAQSTSYRYSDVGQPTVVARDAGDGTALVTSTGYTEQYVSGADASTTVVAPVLAPAANATIPPSNPPVSGAAPAPKDALFVISDETSSLTPRGNQQSNADTAKPYETFYTYDSGNQGLVTGVDSPSPQGGRASTTYTYDPFGQRATMTTPKANAETPAGQTPASYAYTYFADTDTDLSGTTPAGGWLRAETDPAGNSVAYGYDAAGNVARTWDRNATAGQPLANFPGTLATPPSPRFAETLHADPGPASIPTAAQLQTAYAAPWRWTWSQRDPLGNRTHTTYDRNGNPTRMTTARGTLLSDGASAPSTYDTTMTFDAGDLHTATLTPAESKANGAPADEPTLLTYDAYGDRTSVTDPRGAVTGTDYDPLDRPVTQYWTRGTYGPSAPPTCRAATPADGPRFATGITLCSSTVAYDALDQTVSSTDGTGASTTTSYDALGRVTAVTMPRNNNGITSTRNQVTYDADGHVVDSCSARELTEGSGACTAGSVYASHIVYNAAGFPISQRTYRDAGTPLSSTAGYDADGNTTTSTDPDGHPTSTAYDLLDRATAITRPRAAGVSYTSTLGYDPVGDTLSVSTPVDATTSRVTAHSYDADNRVLDTVTGADNPDATQAGTASADGGSNVRTRAVYDPDGNTVATYGPRAFTVSVGTPDPRYLTRSDVDPDGRVTATYTPRYDSADPALNDPTGAGSTQAADCPPGITPAAVTLPASMPALPAYPASTGVCTIRTAYDPAGQPLITTLPTAGGQAPGQTTREVSDTWTDDHLLAARTSPSATGTGTATTSTTYDAIGAPTTVTDPLGHVDTTSYTADHLIAGTAQQGYTRGSDGAVISHNTSAGYDADGHDVADTDALGQVSRTTYTADGLVSARTNTGGGTTRYTYDATGNGLSELSPSGNAKDATNPTGVPTQHTYTDDDLLLSTLQPPSTDGHRRKITWSYDGSGLKTAQNYQETDATGTPVTTTGASGGLQYFAYYPDGRLQTETGRGNTTSTPETITSTYDPAGDTVTAADSTSGGSTLSSTYYLDGTPRTDDGRGGLTRYADNGTGAVAARQQSSPNAATQTSLTTFGDAGLPTRMTSDAVPASASSPWTWAYDAAGRTTTASTPEGQSTTSAYNPDDTLADQTSRRGDPTTGTVVAKWDYQYDDLGRETTGDGTQLQPGPAGTASKALRQASTYDATGRLVANTDSQGAHTSTYDADGNRLSYTTPAGPGTTASTQRTAYNPDDSVMNSNSGQPGATTLTSDYRAAGVLNDDGCSKYAYDGFDRLRSTTAKPGSACATAGTSATASYAYDPLDRQRRSDQITTSTTVTTYSDGTTTTKPDAPVETVTAMSYDGTAAATATETATGKNTRRYTLDPAGTPAAMTFQPDGTTSPTTQYLGTDGHGNITTVTGGMTATGTPTQGDNIACASRLDAWGKPLTTSPTAGASTTGTPSATATATGTAHSGANVGASPDPCPASTTDGTSASASDIYYGGARRDSATGDYQLGSRTYDPAKAAFLSQDTYRQANSATDLAVGTDPLTENRYNYVNGDPVNTNDPTGHCAARSADDLCPNQTNGASEDGNGQLIGGNNTRLTASQRTHNLQAARRNAARALNNESGNDNRRACAIDGLSCPQPKPVVTQKKHKGCGGWLSCLADDASGAASDLYGTAAAAPFGIVNGVTQVVTVGFVNPHLNYCPPGADKTACSVSNRAFSDATQVAGQAALTVGTGGLGDVAEATVVGARAAEGADAAANGLRDAAQSCLNSFTADTPVLMADGKQEAIATVKVGDKVLATDPKTGRTTARPVMALIRHSGKHTMVDLRLSDRSDITSTDHHPFWDATTRTFTDAMNLHLGDQVLSDHGRTLAITGEYVYDQKLTAYNLQIDSIHTYYAGSTPILVHNSGCGDEVSNILKSKLGSIRRAPLPSGAPSWEEIEQMTLDEVRSGARQNLPGYKSILKLLTDGRFNR